MGASGLVAPLEVLRGLANAAVEHKVRCKNIQLSV
jgi:hypothetical protein